MGRPEGVLVVVAAVVVAAVVVAAVVVAVVVAAAAGAPVAPVAPRGWVAAAGWPSWQLVE